ncbi:MAG: CopD family protein [Anaerolineae bacterium]|nr:CopD family protein [Anaerolineae bacterium]MDK1080013.1 CopD family protein [Anaerolineae bacterium]MDK1117240.1 CopD family protein [Anaerolineae bacterium]
MLETPPSWAIALVYWMHLLATVTWVGALATMAILVLPASKRVLNPIDQLAFVEAIQRRLEPIAWFSIAILIVTGLFQMSVNPHYDGFLSTSGQWSLAILTKHIFVIFMIVVSAIQTWELWPAIRRGLIQIERGRADEDQVIRLQKTESMLLHLNIGLSILVLGATAFARAS